MLSPLVEVVALPFDRSDSVSPVGRFVDVETVLIMPRGVKDPSKAIRPVAVQADLSTLQNAFGMKIETKGLIVSFNRTDLKADYEFVFVYGKGIQAGGRGSRERREKIRARELAGWK